LGLYIASIDSPTTRTRIGALTSGPVKYAAGFLWFVRDGTLMAQRFHPDAGQATGEPVPVVEDVEVFAVSESGALVYLPRDRSGVTMTWLDVAGKPAGTVGPAGLFDSGRPDLSSDGRRLVFSTSNASGGSDLWMLDLERNIPTRLMSADTRIAEPRFTPAGSHVVFFAGRNMGLYRRASDGSGTDELLYDPPAVIVGPDTALPSGFSADGKLLLFMTRTPETGADVWILPLEGDRKPFAFAATKSLEGYAAFSPDGRWIAYCSAEPGQGDHIYVEPYPRTGARTRLSSTPGSSPQWSANGREVLYGTPGGLIMRVELTFEAGAIRAGLPRVWQRAPALFGHNSFVLDRSKMRTLVLSGQPGASALTMVLNWPALIASRR
jgi:hypothetical protein